MNTFILTFAVFTLVMAAMAVGVIVNNRAIKGTCGGLNDIDGLDGACDICEVKEQCKRRKIERQALTKTAMISQTETVMVFKDKQNSLRD